MSDKPITIVISDLHVGAADKADDHIYKGEELVRFLRRMGYTAREVDYGVVAVESDDVDRAHLRDYLRIWQGVNGRAAVDLDAA